MSINCCGGKDDVNGKMDCIYIAPLSKALYNLCLSFTRFTHTFTHQRRLAAMQGTNQLVGSNWGLGVLLRDTSTSPGCDRTGNPPTARRLLLPPELHRPMCLSTFSTGIEGMIGTINATESTDLGNVQKASWSFHKCNA